jgi:hypothetical protein
MESLDFDQYGRLPVALISCKHFIDQRKSCSAILLYFKLHYCVYSRHTDILIRLGMNIGRKCETGMVTYPGLLRLPWELLPHSCPVHSSLLSWDQRPDNHATSMWAYRIEKPDELFVILCYRDKISVAVRLRKPDQ